MSAFPFAVSEEQPPDSIKPSQLWEAQLFAFVQPASFFGTGEKPVGSLASRGRGVFRGYYWDLDKHRRLCGYSRSNKI
jgi:hypothetical protein